MAALSIPSCAASSGSRLIVRVLVRMGIQLQVRLLLWDLKWLRIKHSTVFPEGSSPKTHHIIKSVVSPLKCLLLRLACLVFLALRASRWKQPSTFLVSLQLFSVILCNLESFLTPFSTVLACICHQNFSTNRFLPSINSLNGRCSGNMR